MDWIEDLFGISPDGGNGMTELVVLAVSLIAAGLLWKVRRRRRRMN